MAARTKRTADPLRREIAALKRRVSWLEEALKPGKKNTGVDRIAAARTRDDAESDARHAALMEYYDEREQSYLKQNPEILRIKVESEHDLNEFLRSRGLKPDPSRIPRSLDKEVKRIKKGLLASRAGRAMSRSST